MLWYHHIIPGRNGDDVSNDPSHTHDRLVSRGCCGCIFFLSWTTLLKKSTPIGRQPSLPYRQWTSRRTGDVLCMCMYVCACVRLCVGRGEGRAGSGRPANRRHAVRLQTTPPPRRSSVSVPTARSYYAVGIAGRRTIIIIVVSFGSRLHRTVFTSHTPIETRNTCK